MVGDSIVLGWSAIYGWYVFRIRLWILPERTDRWYDGWLRRKPAPFDLFPYPQRQHGGYPCQETMRSTTCSHRGHRPFDRRQILKVADCGSTNVSSIKDRARTVNGLVTVHHTEASGEPPNVVRHHCCRSMNSGPRRPHHATERSNRGARVRFIVYRILEQTPIFGYNSPAPGAAVTPGRSQRDQEIIDICLEIARIENERSAAIAAHNAEIARITEQLIALAREDTVDARPIRLPPAPLELAKMIPMRVPMRWDEIERLYHRNTGAASKAKSQHSLVYGRITTLVRHKVLERQKLGTYVRVAEVCAK